jgi:hypothetical protein
LYAQFRINFAHKAPRTLSEISVGTPAAINARATSSLAFDCSMTSSPRP